MGEWNAQLPFGLRSAPIIFSAVANALEWIAYDRGISCCIHYSDDFLNGRPSRVDSLWKELKTSSKRRQELGFPLKWEKVKGPATTLVFLGIQLDTTTGMMSLPQGKMEQYKRELEQKRACRKRELLSLIGKLAHACKVRQDLPQVYDRDIICSGEAGLLGEAGWGF